MTWHGERWEDRRFRAWLIRAVVFVVPVVAAVVVATVVANALPDPDGLWGSLMWWALVLGSSFGTMWLVDRIARQLLPLAALLRMSLVFPDKAPSRFGVALRSHSSRRMQTEVEQARAAWVDDDPTRAAEFVLAMVASLGDHDRLTRGHAERTRAYTDLLAEELGIPADDRDRLRWVALLHDVGKLGVPAEVLSSDHTLTEDDWAHVRNHPADGYELTRPIHDFLGPWALTILHHHERYDGSGYPAGIMGEDIAYGARVVAVGDAYDAMTAFRTYQPALSTVAARKELAAGRKPVRSQCGASIPQPLNGEPAPGGRTPRLPRAAALHRWVAAPRRHRHCSRRNRGGPGRCPRRRADPGAEQRRERR
jgi:hypothetical protein